MPTWNPRKLTKKSITSSKEVFTEYKQKQEGWQRHNKQGVLVRQSLGYRKNWLHRKWAAREYAEVRDARNQPPREVMWNNWASRMDKNGENQKRTRTGRKDSRLEEKARTYRSKRGNRQWKRGKGLISEGWPTCAGVFIWGPRPCRRRYSSQGSRGNLY